MCVLGKNRQLFTSLKAAKDLIFNYENKTVQFVYKHVRKTTSKRCWVPERGNKSFTNKVIKILSFNHESCTRYSCTLLSNSNRVFTPLLGHVTSYKLKLCTLFEQRTTNDSK